MMTPTGFAISASHPTSCDATTQVIDDHMVADRHTPSHLPQGYVSVAALVLKVLGAAGDLATLPELDAQGFLELVPSISRLF
jgi:hypothetical protein